MGAKPQKSKQSSKNEQTIMGISTITPVSTIVFDSWLEQQSPNLIPTDPNWSFWTCLAKDIKVSILSYFSLRELLNKYAFVSKEWVPLAYLTVTNLNLQPYYQTMNPELLGRIISHCKRLVRLNLGFCSGLGDESMTVIAENQTALEDLDLTDVAITSKSLKIISEKMKCLKTLSCSRTFITDYSYLKNCKSLEHLYIGLPTSSNTAFTEVPPEELSNSIREGLASISSPKLKSLTLYRSPLTLEDAKVVLENQTQLEMLDMRMNPPADPIINSLRSFLNLKTLCISLKHPSSLSVIASLPALTFFRLASSEISVSDVKNTGITATLQFQTG